MLHYGKARRSVRAHALRTLGHRNAHGGVYRSYHEGDASADRSEGLRSRPDGELILATVLSFGEPHDAVEVVTTASLSRATWRSSGTRRAKARASSPGFRITCSRPKERIIQLGGVIPPGRMSLRGSGGRPGGQADRRGCARGLRPRDEKSHLSSSRRLRREELQRKTTRPVGVDHKARVRV